MDFGTVTIHGPAGKIASRDMVPGDPAEEPNGSSCPDACAPADAADGWRRWSMSLTSRNWGVGAGTWNTILSNVTAITIKVDAQDGIGEQIGFDNITVSFLPDCNCNGTPDGCEIQADPSLDCNANGILDACEVLVTGDCNGDCTPEQMKNCCGSQVSFMTSCRKWWNKHCTPTTTTTRKRTTGRKTTSYTFAGRKTTSRGYRRAA